MRRWLTLGSVVIGTSILVLLAPTAARASRDAARTRAALAGLRMPLIANEGQVDATVAFYAPTFAGTLFVTRRGDLVYSLPAPALEIDKSGGIRLAWFHGSPAVLAAPTGEDSWVARRLGEFGEGPCAFILKAEPRASGYKTVSKSRWFGADVSWFDPAALGWRLGVE